MATSSTLKIESERFTNPDGDDLVVHWDAIEGSHGSVTLSKAANHTITDADYAGTSPEVTRLIVLVTAAATITLPSSPTTGQVIEVIKSGAGTYAVTIDANGASIAYRTDGTHGTGTITLATGTTSRFAAAWVWGGSSWVALSVPQRTAYQGPASLALTGNSVVGSNMSSTGQEIAISEGHVLRRVTGSNVESGKVVDDLSSLTPGGITLTANSVPVRASGSGGVGANLVIGEGEVLRRLTGLNVTSGKVLDSLCQIKSTDDLLTLDHLGASEQRYGTIATAANANMDGSGDVANDQYVRITWSIILTFNSVDYICDYFTVFKRISGTLSIMAEKAIISAPAGVVITANVSPGNQPRINIANTTGYTITYHVHYSQFRQVK